MGKGMKWTSVEKALPEPRTEVIVWMKYKGYDVWEWNTSWIDDGKPNPYHSPYVEPKTGKVWAMGSAEGFIISHWMEIEEPG